MLSLFTILTSGGIVLFQRTPSSASSLSSTSSTYLIDRIISEVFLSERSNEKEYSTDGYTLKWTFANELGLIFVAAYSKILELKWINELLVSVKNMFVKMYADALKRGDTPTVIEDLNGVTCKFGVWFDKKLQSYEGGKVSESTISMQELTEPLLAITQSDAEPVVTTDDNSVRTPADSPVLAPINPKGAVAARLRKAKGKGKRTEILSSGDEGRKPNAKAKGKRGRRWGEDGVYDADGGNEILDFSSATESLGPAPSRNIENLVSTTSSAKFELDDDEDGDDDVDDSTPVKGGWAIFRNIVGGKMLTDDDLKEPLEQMHQFLLAKNVAGEVSVHLCDSVKQSLTGQKTGSFQTVKKTLQKAINESLTRILTPVKSTDLLREIMMVRKKEKRPYTISFVGVNGVGKSTNLSKIAFKLLNNGNSVLIAACDTFRSGAVEQLRKHVLNLNEWVELNAKDKDVKIKLFERGYGKDAAEVAAHAVKFADGEGFDVVLIDTAGRRHNDQALMGSLGKFAKQAKPDKILMVAEALVGTDSVSQARSFRNALATASRGLDGFIISKMDTVEDQVGTVVNMVYSTGVPVWFLGVGQMYGDLADFKVEWVVSKLMKSS